ncbi:acyl-CoA dehydrogenase NM domain-like protein [Desarmillaria tabescens]|uniref:Acyl-CoA dehydrogenase NM domain-like protein n=1 Tax=Armillaria tabescens TaxID=1929756 RepID=A0AA39NLY0_ARMTA|nr:acyl-CoA dehydrogenase NM domain-like protein [Desarmillaria tabescens]KAK0468077.1 acyl-CoA dehydrogenase NM domain-like protein [Desarmillaria tabescens]
MSSHRTKELAQSRLFQQYPHDWPLRDRIRLSYQRAQAIGKAYGFTRDDVLNTTEKLWQLHTDPICGIDGAAAILATIQYNLCAGTIAPYATQHIEISETLERVLSFEVSGQFLLTELGHGIDALHLETTATLLPDGSYELNTPHERAGKYMPPTVPMGYPTIAVVMARALVDGMDRGVKSFLAPINDGKIMHPGVVCRYLSQRGGNTPLTHSITYFDHVRIPAYSLLGKISGPVNHRSSFFEAICRVPYGTLALSSLGVPALQIMSTICARYSMRRTVLNNEEIQKPIISFRTQQVPILTALAQAYVMRALFDASIKLFTDVSLDFRVRHAIATATKSVMVCHTQAAALELGERCGAQGLFEINQISSIFNDFRGITIAEGDLLVLSVRLATELLLKRYCVPESPNPESLLSRHELGLFTELGSVLKAHHHRSEEFSRQVLPRCRLFVQSIGERMAYDAAVASGLDPCLVDMYVVSCVKHDSAWYSEELNLSRARVQAMENAAIESMYPRLEEFIARTEVEPYISAPLLSSRQWEAYERQMTVYGDSPRFKSKPSDGSNILSFSRQARL